MGEHKRGCLWPSDPCTCLTAMEQDAKWERERPHREWEERITKENTAMRELLKDMVAKEDLIQWSPSTEQAFVDRAKTLLGEGEGGQKDESLHP